MKTRLIRFCILLTLSLFVGQLPFSALASALVFTLHQSVGADSTKDLALGDLDGDGDLDAFAANSEGVCLGDFDTYYLNDGGGAFTLGGNLGRVNDSHAVDLGDLDGDGDLDAVIAIDYGINFVWPNNLVYFNDGAANFILVQSLYSYQTYDLELGDLDGDDDLDLFVANWYGEPDEVWFNNGSGEFISSGQDLSGDYSIAVKLGDLDGDGDLDAFVGKWSADEVWINDGNGYFTDSGQDIGLYRSEDVALGDLDGDGDLDVAIANQEYGDEIYFNDGSGVFTSSGQYLGVGDGSRGVALGDLDSDGDLDLVLANDYYHNNAVWVNDGTGYFTEAGISLGFYRATQDVEIADLDGDGDLDLFFANYLNDQPNDVWINETPIPNQPPTDIDAGGPYTVQEGGTVELAASGEDPDGDELEFAWDLDMNGDFETPGAIVSFSAAGLDGPVIASVMVQAIDPSGAAAIDLAEIEILNADPLVGSISAPLEPLPVGVLVSVFAPFSDPGLPDTHTTTWTWGDGSTSQGVMSGAGLVTGEHTYSLPGVYELQLSLLDDDGGLGEASYQYVVIYDPEAGFVTGVGELVVSAGACPEICGGASGPAKFGFMSKYLRGQSTPSGHTQFNFQAGDLRFVSNQYDWLVVNRADSNAQFKGSGLINDFPAPDGSGYKFMIWAGDKDDGDTLHLRIWWEQDEVENVVFDNGVDQLISDGFIVIHTK